MSNFKGLFYLSIASVAVVLPWNANAQPSKDAPPAKETGTVMERKLKHAQGLLNGLALNDFDKITREADALILARTEATWKINETEKYMRHAVAFDDQLQRIKKAAKNKNIDAATLAYVDMTLTCVKCHDTLRIQKKNYKDD